MSAVYRSRKLSRLFLSFSLALACLPACRTKTSAPETVYRLIDLLQNGNIVQSPLQGKDPSSLTDAVFPARSTPIPVAESGENLLGLKRKHNFKGSEANILFSPPESSFALDLVLPENAAFDFGIGVVRDRNAEAMMTRRENEGEGVEFIVRLQIGGRKKIVFQELLPLPPLREERTRNFTPYHIALPGAGRKVRLTLTTAGKSGAFSYWSNPVVYNPKPQKTNVILVSIDTLRADHLGAYGYAGETSPAMDELAKDGALFLNTITSSPWTLPAHASMLTGLNGIRHRVYTREDMLDPEAPTLAALLKKRGYFCAAVTGGAFVSSAFGFAKGFDTYDVRGGDITRPDLAEECFGDVSQRLDALAAKNFFLFVHTYQVHSPYQSPSPYNTMFTGERPKRTGFNVLKDLGGEQGVFTKLPGEDRRNIIGLYDGEIRYTDERLIRPLIAKLRRMGLYDRTEIIVTSDHGEQFSEHGSWNHGNFLYNDVLRIPLIIKFPSSRYRGKTVASVVRLIDIMPTILEAAGPAGPDGDFDGQSLTAVLKEAQPQDRAYLADIIDHPSADDKSGLPTRVATNSGPWKFIMNQPWSKAYLDLLTAPPPGLPRFELYDSAQDPGERMNRAGDEPELVRKLQADLSGLYASAAFKKGSKARPNEELEDQLRALGYIK